MEFRSWGALLEAVQHTLLATWRLALPNRLLKELEALEQGGQPGSPAPSAAPGPLTAGGSAQHPGNSFQQWLEGQAEAALPTSWGSRGRSGGPVQRASAPVPLLAAANSDSRGQRASGGGRLLPGAKHALVSRLVRYNSATAAPAQRSWAAGAPGSGTSTAHIGIHYAAQQLGDMQAYETRPWHPGGPASCGGQVLASLVPWQQQANQQQQQQQWLPDAAAGTPPWDLTGPLDGGRRSGNDWALQDPQPVNPLQDARWAQPSREGEAGLCALSYRPPQHQASGRSEGRQTYSVLTAEEQALLRSAAAAGPGQAGRQRAQSAPPHARLRRRVPPIRQPRFTAAPALVAVSGEGSGATAAAAIPSAPACAAVQQEAPLRAAGRPVPSFLHPGAGGLGELLGPWRRPGRKAAAARPSAVAAAPALGGAGFAGPSILTLEALSAAVFAQLKPASLSRQQLGAARALCQVDSKFVPIMHGSLLALVDQHAAGQVAAAAGAAGCCAQCLHVHTSSQRRRLLACCRRAGAAGTPARRAAGARWPALPRRHAEPGAAGCAAAGSHRGGAAAAGGLPGQGGGVGLAVRSAPGAQQRDAADTCAAAVGCHPQRHRPEGVRRELGPCMLVLAHPAHPAAQHHLAPLLLPCPAPPDLPAPPPRHVRRGWRAGGCGACAQRQGLPQQPHVWGPTGPGAGGAVRCPCTCGQQTAQPSGPWRWHAATPTPSLDLSRSARPSWTAWHAHGCASAVHMAGPQLPPWWTCTYCARRCASGRRRSR